MINDDYNFVTTKFIIKIFSAMNEHYLLDAASRLLQAVSFKTFLIKYSSAIGTSTV